MTYTTNYRLKKPGTNDHYNVGDFNENSDTIDRNLKSVSDSTSGLSSTVSTLSGTVSALSSTVSQHGNSIGAVNTELTAQSGRITQVSDGLAGFVSAVGASFAKIGDRYIWERTSIGTEQRDTVTSVDRSAYPDDSTQDGYRYRFAGQVGLRSTVGSYEGTGEYGEVHPSSLTFPFTPKLVIIMGITIPDELAVFIQGSAGLSRPDGNIVIAAWSGTKLSWVSPDSPYVQLNNSGETYWYFAIG